MANGLRARKRVRAPCRAPDGSAYQKCERCGVSVPIVLLDMHDCGQKRAKRDSSSLGISLQPRSPFRFFMESFEKTFKTRNLLKIEQEGFNQWVNMSQEERSPYIIKAEEINSIYHKMLLKEGRAIPKADDEADSATVGKFDPRFRDSLNYDDLDILESFESDDWYIGDSWSS
ncbi:HMG box-containing protein [Dioscorea alata]|uniref:HMG box-containing protein n=1 Tax=Dioscorea alata TaxID=55571 RepID=A0ACB7VTS4_DIOAL|nr:HMG box-containing protein [Dioscorea alata]